MSVLADVFAAVRLQLDQAGFTAQATKAADSAGKTMGQRLNASIKKSWSGAEVGKGLVQGLGFAGALGAASLLTRGIGALTDAFQDSIRAAIEDQASIARYTAAVKANVPAWDGNTKAIERVIKARQALGFTDEEQRDSFARTVVATKDINEALAIQATAMDLARLKRISLAEATDALIKVEAGQYRGLKALGIQLKTGATQTEALAAVTAVAQGQAEAYAETTEGRMLRAQIAINEKLEDIGYKILPAVADGLGAVNFLLGDTSDSLEDLRKKATEPGGFFDVFASNEAAFRLERLTKVAGELGLSVEDLYRIVQDRGINIGTAKLEDYKAAISEAADESITAAENIKHHSFDVIAKSADHFSISVEQAARNSIFWMKQFVNDAISEAKRLRGEAFDETEIRAQLHDTRLEILRLADEKRNAKTKEDRRQLSDDIIQAIDDEGQSLEDLAAQGKLTQQDVNRFAKDARANYGSLSRDAQADIEKVITKYGDLAKLADVTKSFTIDVKVKKLTPDEKKLLQAITKHAAGHGPLVGDDGYASGGRPRVGVPAWVGEKGPELWVPDQPGTIIPHDQSMTLASSSGGYTDQSTVNIELQGLMRVETPADLRREMQMISDVKRIRRPAGAYG